MMRAVRRIAPALVAAALVASGCGDRPVKTVQQRTYASRDSGYRYVAPVGWDVLRGEVRSPSKSLITIQVASLENADETFLADLPHSYIPQLEGWTKYYFSADGAPATRPTTLGGLAALEVSWPIRIRPADPPGSVVYWVASNAGYLYVIRVVFPAGAFELDEPGVREFLASWQFTEPAGPPEGGPPGTLILSVPEPIVTPPPRRLHTTSIRLRNE
jgi:hypothetical protein